MASQTLSDSVVLLPSDGCGVQSGSQRKELAVRQCQVFSGRFRSHVRAWAKVTVWPPTGPQAVFAERVRGVLGSRGKAVLPPVCGQEGGSGREAWAGGRRGDRAALPELLRGSWGGNSQGCLPGSQSDPGQEVTA